MLVNFTQDKTRITVTAGNASYTATFNSDGHSRQVMLCRMTQESDGITGKLLGITKSRVHQIRNRFIEVVRTRLQLEVA